MNKLTVVLNDYAGNIKSLIAFGNEDAEKVAKIWDIPDERLMALHVLPPFRGYECWSELTPNHYRILITRALNSLSTVAIADRTNGDLTEVATANFLILAFLTCLEKRTASEIEHFRINRFDELNVTFDYSASFEVEYPRPSPKIVDADAPEPSFSIVVDNSHDD